MQDKIVTSINEVRREICICGVGDKAFLDMAIGGRLRLKNELEANSFKKVFGIPNGVALDQIEVCFNEEDAILMILMPKSINFEGEVGERGTREIVGKVDEDELNRNGLATKIHQEEDEETKHEEVDESNKEFDPPKRPLVEIKAPNIEQQLSPPPVGAKAKGIEEKHNGQPSKEDESPGTSEVIPQNNIDKEQEEQEKQEDKKGGMGKSHEIKEEDQEQVHELDDKPIYEKGLPQQLIEEPETSNEDKLPMKEKGIVDEREASEVDKEHIEEQEDTSTHNKGLPRQPIQELETSKKDELSTKEMKGKKKKKEQGGGLGVPPPSLVVSAFLLSLAALVIKLVRNQKRT